MLPSQMLGDTNSSISDRDLYHWALTVAPAIVSLRGHNPAKRILAVLHNIP